MSYASAMVTWIHPSGREERVVARPFTERWLMLAAVRLRCRLMRLPYTTPEGDTISRERGVLTFRERPS